MPRRPDPRGPSAVCQCGLPPYVGVSNSAKHRGRTYATCSRFPASSACRYFAWLDGWAPNIGTASTASTAHSPPLPAAVAEPPTPERVAAPPRSAALPPATPTALPAVPASPAAPADALAPLALPTSERFAALLLVVVDASVNTIITSSSVSNSTSSSSSSSGLLLPGSQAEERVRLLLLPASAHPPAHCTQHLAGPAVGRRLPHAPAALRSLQPPYVTLSYCPAARGLAQAVGWASGDGPLLVLDTETTGLSGRDYIHQLAVVNLSTCQLLTALLRTCPRTIGPQAAKVCGARNEELHDENRPTFGQLAPLLHAFIDGAASLGSGHSSSSGPAGSSGPGVGYAGSGCSGGKRGTHTIWSATPPALAATAAAAAAAAGSTGHSGAAAACAAAGRAARNFRPLIVAHNGGFDVRMLIGEWGRRGLAVPRDWRLLDTLPLARACVANCANHRQGTLRERFGLALPPGEQEHDAGTDATVLARLLPHLVTASGASRLADIVEGRVCKKSGESFARTFAHVQDRMRGAAQEEPAAEAEVFTCPFCYARVVE